eukprot:TRINITY_DN67145_c0_g1_i1.p1 TRINITY_DN67145_c0_g1~~TRINITY_DN67145_c0_g1_i1.p1  ORF type:complete len:226 (+),score=24.90 TRINITY_DN67145_c0_g1_i1:364-1041(+)
MIDNGRPAVWERLFGQALSIIGQTQVTLGFDVSWTFGGGTALMLQIDHRDSFDIDIFIDDPQVLPFLNARTQGHKLDIWPDDYQTDGVRALKLVFAGLGEIDFICASQLTKAPATSRCVLGNTIDLETPAEIISKKIVYRGASLQPRDMFDIACVARCLGDRYVHDALAPFRENAMRALAVAKTMDAGFAKSVMQNLVHRPAFQNMPDDAQNITIELLQSVCSSN